MLCSKEQKGTKFKNYGFFPHHDGVFRYFEDSLMLIDPNAFPSMGMHVFHINSIFLPNLRFLDLYHMNYQLKCLYCSQNFLLTR